MTMRLRQNSMSEVGSRQGRHKVDEFPNANVSRAETMQACRNVGISQHKSIVSVSRLVSQ